MEWKLLRDELPSGGRRIVWADYDHRIGLYRYNTVKAKYDNDGWMHGPIVIQVDEVAKWQSGKENPTYWMYLPELPSQL